MSNQETRFDRLNARVKNNPVIATLLLLGTGVIALSTFSDATKNVLGLFVQETRPPVNGLWKGTVIYDWPNATYDETFVFKGEGEEVQGTASFLGIKRGIWEGNTKSQSISFLTKTGEIMGSLESKEVLHHYRGRIQGDEIHFVMQTEGGYSEHIPIEFIVRRQSSDP